MTRAIVFEDADAGTRTERRAEEVPESVAWAMRDGRRIPVVRVVARMRGADRELQSFGEDGALLATTVQRRG